MKLQHPELVAQGDPKALAAIMPVITKCARAGAIRVGAEFLVDDVVQELAMLLVTKLAAKYDPTYNIEPLLIGCARHISLGMLQGNREFNRESLEDIISCDNNMGLDEAQPDHDISVERLDVEKAEQRIRNAMEATMELIPGVIVGDATAPKKKANAVNKQPANSQGKIPRLLTPEQKHMREMRIKLNYSQATWAKHLDVSTATVAAIEYGRVQKVNKEIYAKALAAFEDGGHVIENRAKFDNRPMSEILDDWAKRLNVDPQDSRALAKLLKKEPSTIFRWRNNQQRPDIHALEEYDDRVTRLAEYLKEEIAIKEQIVLKKPSKTKEK